MNEDNFFSFVVSDKDEGIRIDKLISEYDNDLSRTFVQKMIADNNVLVNGKSVKANYKVCLNDSVECNVPLPQEAEILPENIELNIIYEDKDILIVNKPKGMVVHPSAGHYSGTLVNALMFYCKQDLSGINGVLRPGIVHRIDMDTTGTLIVCKNDAAHRNIAEQLKVHSINRYYDALVYGTFKTDVGTINEPIGRHPVDRKKMAINYKNGKEAITNYKVIEGFRRWTHVECKLDTGRTHQIRVHMSSINHPLLGDTVYGPSSNEFKLTGQTLHARSIGFIHPTTNQYVEFIAPLPQYFIDLKNKLRQL